MILQMVLHLKTVPLLVAMTLQMIPTKIPPLMILQMKTRTRPTIRRKMKRRTMKRNRKRNSRQSLSAIFSLRQRQR